MDKQPFLGNKAFKVVFSKAMQPPLILGKHDSISLPMPPLPALNTQPFGQKELLFYEPKFFNQRAAPSSSSSSFSSSFSKMFPQNIYLNEENYCELMKDPYERTLANPEEASTAIIVRRLDHSKIAYQYYPPLQSKKIIPIDAKRKSIVPAFRSLGSLEEIHDYGSVKYRATSSNGTLFFGRTSLHIRLNTPEWGEADAEFVSFLPASGSDSVYRGIKEPQHIFKLPAKKRDQKELLQCLEKSGIHIKGGPALCIDPTSIAYRKEIKDRKPNQNKVMKRSAVHAYKDFLNDYGHILSPHLYKIIQESVEAPLHNPFGSYKRTEWLHLYGFGLTPKTLNPQVALNLGAGPKWANTEMMISEYIVQWLGQHAAQHNLQNISMSIQPRFEMILDTDIIKHIDFKTQMSFNGRSITTYQSINPFSIEPYRHKCDVAFGALLMSKILSGVKPDQAILVESPIPRCTSKLVAIKDKSEKTSRSLANDHFFISALKKRTPYFIDSNAQKIFTERFDLALIEAQNRALMLPASQGQHSRSAANKFIKNVQHFKEVVFMERNNPTIESDGKEFAFSGKKGGGMKAAGFKASETRQSSVSSLQASTFKNEQIAKAIIKIKVCGFDYDYSTPYGTAEQTSWTGSGFVVYHNGEKIIITNAHVIDNSNHIQICSIGKHEKSPAYLEYASSEADLAIIRPKNPSFFNGITPVTLSETLYWRPGTDISVKGYPLGGEELCETYGKISRIEVASYVHRDQALLQFQVDAAINPGNSGGPVFHEDEVIGVAFQGNKQGESLGYIIPNVIVKHFLEDRMKDPFLRGFPEFPISYQSVENKTQKELYGLVGPLTGSGVLVTKIPPLCSGRALLKKKDLIVRLNGKKVNSDGTIDYPWREHVDMNHEVRMMHLGQNLELQVLRKGSLKNLSIKLSNKFGDTRYVRPTRYNRKPTYLIESGFVFAPVSENNIDDLEDEVFKGVSIFKSCKTDSKDEIIYLSNILISESTESYEGAEKNILKAVNGVDIKNMPQLLAVLDSIEVGAIIEFVMTNEHILHVKKFDEHQNRKMCRRHDIRKLISDDLSEEQISDYFLRDIELPNVTHPTLYRKIFMSQGLAVATAFNMLSDTDEDSDEDSDEEKSTILGQDKDEEENNADISGGSGLVTFDNQVADFKLDSNGPIASRKRALCWSDQASTQLSRAATELEAEAPNSSTNHKRLRKGSKQTY